MKARETRIAHEVSWLTAMVLAIAMFAFLTASYALQQISQAAEATAFTIGVVLGLAFLGHGFRHLLIYNEEFRANHQRLWRFFRG